MSTIELVLCIFVVAGFVSVIVLQYTELRSYRRYIMSERNVGAFASTQIPSVKHKISEDEKAHRLLNSKFDAAIMRGEATEEDLKTFEQTIPVIQ